jgi:hypothetical protein
MRCLKNAMNARQARHSMYMDAVDRSGFDRFMRIIKSCKMKPVELHFGPQGQVARRPNPRRWRMWWPGADDYDDIDGWTCRKFI